MSNISQIKTQGTGVILEDIEVVQDYGAKPGQTPHRAILVKDASDKTIIKIWGAASSVGFNQGDILTVKAVGAKGKIEANEYNGKISLNCNDCEITSSGGGVPAAETAQNVTSYQAAPTKAQGLTPEELADAQVAHFARIIKRLQPLAEGGIMDAEKLPEVAASMVGSASDWWFGQKYPGCQ